MSSPASDGRSLRHRPTSTALAPAALPRPVLHAALKNKDSRKSQRRGFAARERELLGGTGSVYWPQISDSSYGTKRKRTAVDRYMPTGAEPQSLPAKKPEPPSMAAQMTGLDYCKQIHADLIGKHGKYSWPFHHPVAALGLEDYTDIIPTPMDLSTIRSKMYGAQYSSMFEFAVDIRLMLSNCYRYNKPDNEVFRQAKRLHVIFEAAFINVPPIFTGCDGQYFTTVPPLVLVTFALQELQQNDGKKTDVPWSVKAKQILTSLQRQMKLLMDKGGPNLDDGKRFSQKRKTVERLSSASESIVPNSPFSDVSSSAMGFAGRKSKKNRCCRPRGHDSSAVEPSLTKKEICELQADIIKQSDDSQADIIDIISRMDPDGIQSSGQSMVVDFERLSEATLLEIKRHLHGIPEMLLHKNVLAIACPLRGSGQNAPKFGTAGLKFGAQDDDGRYSVSSTDDDSD